jgi:hypothetical protein
MRTRNGSYAEFYLPLSPMVCVALSAANAVAQNETSHEIPATFGRTMTDPPNPSASATPVPKETTEIDSLKAQLELQQRRIEQLERMLDEQKKVTEQPPVPRRC